MNYDYETIRELFGLNEPDGLPEEQIEIIRKHFGAIPKALENYYRLCGGCANMNASQDFLLTPDRRYGYYLLEAFNYPGYCVFYVENQCVSEWAVKTSDLHQENPPVYATNDGGQTWYPVCEHVSLFLTAQGYLQASFSLPYSSEDFFDMTKEQTAKFADYFHHVGADIHLYNNDIQFFRYGRALLVVMESNDAYDFVWYASDDENNFEQTEKIIDSLIDEED